MQRLIVSLPDHQYSIDIGRRIIQQGALPAAIYGEARQVVVVTDDNVGPVHGEVVTSILSHRGIPTTMLTIKAGEQHKTRATKEYIEDELFKLNLGRDGCLIAVGGGVVCDLVGFVAATYYRGIPVIYLPTSLLAMVDAAIGGKTAVNTSHGKNLIGCIKQPDYVLMEMVTLSTLPREQWYEGWVELIKHALIKDADFFALLEEIDCTQISFKDPRLIDWIYQSCDIKRQVIEYDVDETNGMRHILNFGHTLAHAFEQASRYAMSHGMAVHWGLLGESYLSWRMDLLPEFDFLRIQRYFKKQDVAQQSCLVSLCQDEIKKYLSFDKKAIDREPRFVLLEALGKTYIEEGRATTHAVDKKLIDETLQWLMQQQN